jgi:hypothetical protein
MKYVNDPQGVPSGKHWAILVFSSIHIPGDERSRTNPGHGYPASTETKISYNLFETEEAWKADIAARTKRGDKKFVPIEANRPVVTKHVTVDVG